MNHFPNAEKNRISFVLLHFLDKKVELVHLTVQLDIVYTHLNDSDTNKNSTDCKDLTLDESFSLFNATLSKIETDLYEMVYFAVM